MKKCYSFDAMVDFEAESEAEATDTILEHCMDHDIAISLHGEGTLNTQALDSKMAADCFRLAVKDKTEFGSVCFILTEHQFNHALGFLDKYEPKMEALQAKIDALMLEYCPDEMTTEQRENWGKHQQPVTDEEMALYGKGTPKTLDELELASRTCKPHGKWPCRKCGTKHYPDCQCSFCKVTWRNK